jgi:alkanesulfonate monooxygenase SsuD/methylene tetrahydromethanopterin reductase-like flavin-dependent oxidoreductase (luciferase family)
MRLGLFFMPLHRPEKPWALALAEDREAILLGEKHGYAEAWLGEHFTSKAEQVPSPLIFLASLISETSNIRFGTGVVNLGHRHPIVVAAEAALFDQLSGGRLMLGVGPGGLASDAEIFGRGDMASRVEAATEAMDMIIRVWTEQPPIVLDGKYWQASLQDEMWPSHGVGEFPKPLQQPHPPLAMAMVSPGGNTAEMIAARSMIPISANFVPTSFVRDQWLSYAAKREELGLAIDPSIWRVCRSILITDSDQQAAEILADPEGVFSYYFRYLRGVAKMTRIDQSLSATELNEQLGVAGLVEQCMIVGTADTVTDRLVAMADEIGRFGTLVSVGHDWDGSGTWERSIVALAEQVAPKVGQHVDSL